MFKQFFQFAPRDMTALNRVIIQTLIVFLISWFISNMLYHNMQSIYDEEYFDRVTKIIFYGWIVISALFFLYYKTFNTSLAILFLVFRVVSIQMNFALNEIEFSDIFSGDDISFIVLLLIEMVGLSLLALRLVQLSFHRVKISGSYKKSRLNYLYDFTTLDKKYFFILSFVFFTLGFWGILASSTYYGFFLFGLVSFAFLGMLTLGIIYLSWKLIGDSNPLTKTLLLLVPFYNFFHIFVAVRDYPAAYNQFCQRNNIQSQLDEQPFSWMSWGLLLLAIFGKKFPFAGLIYFLIVLNVSNKLLDSIKVLENTQTMDVDSQKDEEYGLFFALVAKVAKADGRISELEAEIISNLLDDISRQFPNPYIARPVFKAIFEMEKNSINDAFDKANLLYKKVPSEQKRIQYFEFLLSLAFDNGEIDESEEKMLFGIYNSLRLDSSRYKELFEKYKILSMNRQKNYSNSNSSSSNTTSTDPYSVLGCSSTDTNEHIKTQYRTLVKKYHPDIISGQGLDAEFIELATKKLQQINGAYETIKKQRGM